jgi:hypothetical protein
MPKTITKTLPDNSVETTTTFGKCVEQDCPYYGEMVRRVNPKTGCLEDVVIPKCRKVMHHEKD